ncbi:Hypothetical protein SRAE_2000395600 [Strongyloides ratti]|uniref:Uncharacterized protein n=1 Tax=Strongyloides ratti TaxID=34506 RepID=A0A090LHN3_STRRB|nr:Hypothetical protein SRAE_2000395600 [Strongyloides ratti]CEF69306.1 Hypothetical protein SRAE_2000395600 [Strongyloides ratti]
MVLMLIDIFILASFLNIISYFIFQCTPNCKKYFDNTSNPSFQTSGNFFGANNKKVASEITVVRPATSPLTKPKIIQPSETKRTKKEEEIAKGNNFTKKDNHPTFEDINDDWEPSIEDTTTTITVNDLLTQS